MARIRTISEDEARYRAALAARIREALAVRGLSRAEVERRSGMHRNVLRQYEEGTVMPSPFSLLRLARAMDVSPGQLLRGPRTLKAIAANGNRGQEKDGTTER